MSQSRSRGKQMSNKKSSNVVGNGTGPKSSGDNKVKERLLVDSPEPGPKSSKATNIKKNFDNLIDKKKNRSFKEDINPSAGLPNSD